MIWESRYWKDPLLKACDLIRSIEFSENDEEYEDALGLLEREILVGFFAVRKLIESRKLSDDTVGTPVRLQRHKVLKAPDIFERYWIDEHYQIERHYEVQATLKYACDQFVHSYVLVFDGLSRERPTGVFVTSDRDRVRFLNWISIEEVLNIFERAGSDYPDYLEVNRGDDGQQVIARVSRNPPKQ